MIEVSLSNNDEIVHGMVPRRLFGSSETEAQVGLTRNGYFFLRSKSRVTRNLATSASHVLFDGKVGHIVSSLFDYGTGSVSFPGTHRCFSSNHTK